jgi:SAM-dependent methyltransferase
VSEDTNNADPSGQPPDFFKLEWQNQYIRTRTPLHKLLIYRLLRPFLSWKARRHLSAETLSEFSPQYVFQLQGWPLEWMRKRATADIDIRQSTILVQGTGTGWDVIGWASLKPKRIIATDLYASPEIWGEISAYCRKTFGTPVEFHEAPMEDHSFLEDGSVDICVSDAVFEHIKNFPGMLAETFRLLRPGGFIYAQYGPLWFGAGGDHYSGRGGLQTVFNHLTLDAAAYREYFYGNLRKEEDWQAGGRYYELDLFSRLTTRQYLDYFRAAGFDVRWLILFVSEQSVEYRARFPDQFREIGRRFEGKIRADDLLISGNAVLLQKPAPA